MFSKFAELIIITWIAMTAALVLAAICGAGFGVAVMLFCVSWVAAYAAAYTGVK